MTRTNVSSNILTNKTTIVYYANFSRWKRFTLWNNCKGK